MNEFNLTTDQEKVLHMAGLDMRSRPRNNIMCAAVDGYAGTGKLQPYDAPVLTPEGFKPMIVIQKGATVYGQHGRPQKVLEAYPGKDLKIYKVTFCDGSSVECCVDHLWRVQTTKGIATNKFIVRTLSDLIKSGLHISNKRGFRFAVQLPKAIQFPKKELKIHPYLLGVLLGNGHLKNNYVITMHIKYAEEMLQNLVPLLPEGVIAKLCKWQKSNPNAGKIIFNAKINHIFKELGLHNVLSKFKHIPLEYLLSSVDDRLELLKGLMDTDGCIKTFDTKNKVDYSTASNQLAFDVQNLVRSLGGYSCLTFSDRGVKGMEYRVTVRLPFVCAKLKDKVETLQKHDYKFRFNKKIVSAEFVGYKDGQCILVDDPDHLYVCGDYTVTHNTTMIPNIIQESNFKSSIIMAPTNKAVGVIKSKLSGHDLTNCSYATLHSIIYGKPSKEGTWIPKYETIDNNLIIVDESSMVTEQVYNDLLKRIRDSYILFIGDSFQLEPVGSPCPIFDLPTTKLTQVVRHDNGILNSANNLRVVQDATVALNDDIVLVDKNLSVRQFAEDIYYGKDAVMICATNNARVAYNKIIRQAIGKKERIDKDPLIAVNNSSEYDNGEIFVGEDMTFIKSRSVEVPGVGKIVIDIYKQGEITFLHVPNLMSASLHTLQFKDLDIATKIDLFGKENIHVATGIVKNVVITTWGYAVSAHKSQGSQWETVYVDFDYCSSNWNASRWLYTGITRASKKVILLPSKNINFV